MNWISVKDRMPPENCGFILVTNNINARSAFDNMSHVWLSSMLHKQDDGSYVAFAHPGLSRAENITHWSLAAPAVANAAKTDELPPLPEPLDDRLLFKLVNALGAFGSGVSRDSIGPQQEAVGKLDAYLMGMMRDYARAAIAATTPNTAVVLKWEPLTKAGQVKKGDYVRFDLCGERKTHQVALMLNPGTDKEEIIYHRRNNWYLITSMSVKGEGSQKNVEILPVSAFVAAHAGQGAKEADHG